MGMSPGRSTGSASSTAPRKRGRPKNSERKAPVVQLSRRSLYDGIADHLRDRIVEGKLAPGSFIDELELAKSLGVSRTPIREALKVLAFEGLVTIFPNRGSYVIKLAPGDAEALIEVLAELEGFAAFLACQRATDDDLRVLTRLHEDMAIAYDRQKKLEYFNLNQDIHEKIVAVTGNAYLVDTHRAYTSRLRRIRYLATPTPELWRSSIEEHAAILDALTHRDAERARALVREHVGEIWPMVESVLQEETVEASA